YSNNMTFILQHTVCQIIFNYIYSRSYHSLSFILGAISPLTSALTLTKKYHMELMESIVYLHLAHVQLQLGMPLKSLEAAEEHLPRILSHGT
ncbi:Uncharacterized protein FKW44_010921, partial [Caligus rogercresseyi]